MDKVRDFFSNEYEIPGKHGKYVKILTSAIGENSKSKKQIKLFDTNISIFINAPIVGYLYNNTADKDNSDIVAKIAGTQMMAYSEIAKDVMRTILLLDENYEPNKDKRFDKAFRYFGENADDIKRFEAFMRGGIEILYEKIIGNSTNPFEIADNLITFVYEFQSMFNEKVGENEILSLCNEFAGKQK